MKLDQPLEPRQPILVALVRRVVVKNDMDLLVLRLVGQHVIQEAAKILPLLILRKLRLPLARADLESGKQIQRSVTLVGALQPANYFAAVGLHVARSSLDGLYAWFFVHAQHHGIYRPYRADLEEQGLRFKSCSTLKFNDQTHRFEPFSPPEAPSLSVCAELVDSSRRLPDK